jgi:hypothetical protein
MESKRKQRARRIHSLVHREIVRRAIDMEPPAEILRALKTLAKTESCGWTENDVPSLPTIREIAKESTPNDPSSPWDFGESDGEEAKLLLDVAVAVLDRTGARVTNREAAWIMKLRKTVPGLHGLFSWWMAREYLARMDHGRDAHDLDARLVFTPPLEASAQARYKAASALGRLFARHWPERLPLPWVSGAMKEQVALIECSAFMGAFFESGGAAAITKNVPPLWSQFPTDGLRRPENQMEEFT